MAKKATAPVVEEVEVEDDNLEELEEVVAEAAAPKRTRKKAAKAQPERKGKNTREVAEELGTTPTKLRRMLRSNDFFNDKDYTRYDLTEEDIARLKAAIEAGATGRPKKAAGPKKSRSKKAQVAAEEVTAELEELDDLAEDDEVELDEVDLDDEDLEDLDDEDLDDEDE